MRDLLDLVKGVTFNQLIQYLVIRDPVHSNSLERIRACGMVYETALKIKPLEHSDTVVFTGFEEHWDALGNPAFRFLGSLNPGVGSIEETGLAPNTIFKTWDRVRYVVPDIMLDYAQSEFIVGELFGEYMQSVDLYHQEDSIIGLDEADALRERIQYWKERAHVQSLVRQAEKLYIMENARKDVLEEVYDFCLKEYFCYQWTQIIRNADQVEWFSEMRSFDQHNLPSARKAFHTHYDMSALSNSLHPEQLDECAKNHWRIIIEERETKTILPLVYVRDREGNRNKMDDYSFEQIICMEIYYCGSQPLREYEILAILMFYVAYPIRAYRIIRHGLLTRFIKMIRGNENDLRYG